MRGFKNKFHLKRVVKQNLQKNKKQTNKKTQSGYRTRNL